jgi:hypothetical protein
MRGSRRGRGAASSRRWHWQKQRIWRGCGCTPGSSGQGCRSWGRRRRQQRPRGGRLSWWATIEVDQLAVDADQPAVL